MTDHIDPYVTHTDQLVGKTQPRKKIMCAHAQASTHVYVHALTRPIHMCKFVFSLPHICITLLLNLHLYLDEVFG